MNARIEARNVIAPVTESWIDTFRRRWWPALIPVGLTLFCAVVLGVQQRQIAESQSSIAALNEAVQAKQAAKVQLEGVRENFEAEIARLRETKQKLAAEVQRLEQLKQEKEQLRAKLNAQAALPAQGIAEPVPMQEKAEATACVSNLKQIALAVRVWSMEHEDQFPPDVVTMSKELNRPQILVCPSDHGRQAAIDFASFTSANISYELFLDPPGSYAEPTRVLTRCPIHGSIGLYDGSVQSTAKEHPEWLVHRDGKLYFESTPKQEEPK